MSYSTNRRIARLSSSGRKQKQQKDSSRYPSFTSIKIAEGANRYYVSKNENQIGTGEFILRKPLLLELLQECTDPNRSWLLSFPSACEQIKCWHAPKRFGAKKCMHNLHGNCQKKKKHSSWYTTANRQRQHCWQMQVKQRKGKVKMTLGNDVSPKRWRKQGSYQRVPTAISEGQSFQPFQDTQFIPQGWCCQWSSLRATDIPLVQLSDPVAVLWLCRQGRRTGRP